MHFLSFSASTCTTMSGCGRLLLPTAIRDGKPNIEQRKKRGLVRPRINNERKSKCRRKQNPTHEYKIYLQMNGFAWMRWHRLCVREAGNGADFMHKRFLHCQMHPKGISDALAERTGMQESRSSRVMRTTRPDEPNVACNSDDEHIHNNHNVRLLVTIWLSIFFLHVFP